MRASLEKSYCEQTKTFRICPRICIGKSPAKNSASESQQKIYISHYLCLLVHGECEVPEMVLG